MWRRRRRVSSSSSSSSRLKRRASLRCCHCLDVSMSRRLTGSLHGLKMTDACDRAGEITGRINHRDSRRQPVSISVSSVVSGGGSGGVGLTNRLRRPVLGGWTVVCRSLARRTSLLSRTSHVVCRINSRVQRYVIMPRQITRSWYTGR